MKTFIVRSVFGVAAAMLVAGGLLLNAKSAEAAEFCYLILHNSSDGQEEIVINERGWNGHWRHGDTILDYDVECPVDEELL
jgi:hypothetical protein